MCSAGRAALALQALVMAGCGLTRDVPPAPITVPASLVAPCLPPDVDPQTVGELKLAYFDALLVIASCDERLGAIRGLSAESTKPE